MAASGKNNVSASVRRMTETAVIAALYTAVTLLLAPVAFGPVQLRLSEVLTLLPVLTPSAVTGITLGCAISNAVGIATGANICGALDIAVGTAATLSAALLTRKLRNITVGKAGIPLLSALPPVLLNGIAVGAELSAVYGLPFWLAFLDVAGGELLSVAAGLVLLPMLRKLRVFGESGIASGRNR